MDDEIIIEEDIYDLQQYKKEKKSNIRLADFVIRFSGEVFFIVFALLMYFTSRNSSHEPSEMSIGVGAILALSIIYFIFIALIFSFAALYVSIKLLKQSKKEQKHVRRSSIFLFLSICSILFIVVFVVVIFK